MPIGGPNPTPIDIHGRLKTLAQSEWRSLNQEIVRRLALSIAADEKAEAVRP